MHTANSVSSIVITAVIGLAFALATIGCDNPVENHHDEHSEAHGLVLLAAGDEVLRVEEAQISDTLRVPLGGTTPLFEIDFLDEDGNLLHADDLDDDFEPDWEVADSTVLEVEVVADWSFSLTGLTADTTTFVIQLLHIGHPDFTTPDIPVVVR